jgi:hypothetical protein
VTRIRYGGDPSRPVWCTATNADGTPCNNKVGVSGAVCAVHRRVAERKWREKHAAATPSEDT